VSFPLMPACTIRGMKRGRGMTESCIFSILVLFVGCALTGFVLSIILLELAYLVRCFVLCDTLSFCCLFFMVVNWVFLFFCRVDVYQALLLAIAC
jgi:hypothetical protein